MKKITKTKTILLMVFLTVIMSLCLTACGDMIGNVTGGGTTSSTGENTKSAKPELSEAAENFDKENVKKSNIDVRLKAVLQTKEPAGTHNIGSTIKVERVQNGDKIYVGTAAVPSDTDAAIGSFLTLMMQSKSTSGEKEGYTNDIRDTLETIHHYLTGQVEMKAELGAQNGVYNLKALFNDKEEDVTKDVWLVADNQEMNKWISGSSKVEVSADYVENYLMKTVFSGLKKSSALYLEDSANKYVDKKGQSSYDISLDADVLVASTLFSSFLDVIGVKNKEAVMQETKTYLDKITEWISVVPQNVNAEVKNNLPSDIQTGFDLNFKVKQEELISIIDSLKDNMEEDAYWKTRFIIGKLGEFIAGPNGETDYIGLKLAVNMTEKFTYEKSKCNLNEKEQEGLFTAIDAKVEGRQKVSDVIAVNVDAYIADFLAGAGEKYADKIDEIAAKIKTAAGEYLQENGLANISVKELRQIIISVLAEYVEVDMTDDNGDPIVTEEQIDNAIDFAKDLYNKWKK